MNYYANVTYNSFSSSFGFFPRRASCQWKAEKITNRIAHCSGALTKEMVLTSNGGFILCFTVLLVCDVAFIWDRIEYCPFFFIRFVPFLMLNFKWNAIAYYVTSNNDLVDSQIRSFHLCLLCYNSFLLCTTISLFSLQFLQKCAVTSVSYSNASRSFVLINSVEGKILHNALFCTPIKCEFFLFMTWFDFTLLFMIPMTCGKP